jgi:hypothetical protein
MIIFEYIGIITIAVLVIFLILGIAYKRIKKAAREVKTVIAGDRMPKLQPLPIPTKNQSAFRRILVWMFEVRRWSLQENWFYAYEGGYIVIPREFDFDGASIPRPFWFFLSPVGLLLIPGLIHDYGYRYGFLWKITEGRLEKFGTEYKRRHWDRVFKNVGRAVNGFAVIDWLAWLALWIGGGGAWKSWNLSRTRGTEKPVLTNAESIAYLGKPAGEKSSGG